MTSRRWITALLASLAFCAATRSAIAQGGAFVLSVDPGSDVAEDDVRRAIAGELGGIVTPRDAPPDTGTLDVASRDGVIIVRFRDAHGRTLEREITAPADQAARVRLIARLAGNLARNEAEELLALRSPAPAPSADARTEVTLRVMPGEKARVEVDATARPAVTAPPIATAAPNEGGAQRAIGWTAIVAGGLSVGAGIYFGVRSVSDKNAASSSCDSNTCSTRTGKDLSDRAQSNATLSTWALIGGAALVAGGVILELTAPSASSSTHVAVGPRGIDVRGTF
jgi:hypothetical protein